MTASLDALADKLCELFDDGVPAVVRALDAPFSTAEVFEWVRRVHPPASCRHGAAKIDAVKRSWGLSPSEGSALGHSAGRPLEMYREGGNLLDPSPFVPTDADASFEAWVGQTTGALGGPFGVMAPGLECASWSALDRLQTLLGPTLRRTGARGYRFNAFFGDYRRSPFGYHLDPHQECVFQFSLHGVRRARFWEGLVLGEEDASWVDDPNGRSSPQRKPDLEVELHPGDLVFWPGTHVHGFEAAAPSMGLSLVIDRTSPRAREDVIAGLEVATLGGRTALPEADEGVELDPDAPLRRRRGAQLSFDCHDDDLIVAVRGRSFVWPDRTTVPVALDLLTALQSEVPVSPNALSKRFHGRGLDREEIHGVLATLAELGLYAVDGAAT